MNARDAMPGGGRLTIETANATLDEGSGSRRCSASCSRAAVPSTFQRGGSRHVVQGPPTAGQGGSRALYMSGYTDTASAPDGQLESGAGFLQKPLGAELLARKLRAVLDGTEA